MNSLSILIPISVLLLTIAVLILRWAVKNGQYDDLDKPGHSILFDDDQTMIPESDRGKEKGTNVVSEKLDP